MSCYRHFYSNTFLLGGLILNVIETLAGCPCAIFFYCLYTMVLLLYSLCCCCTNNIKQTSKQTAIFGSVVFIMLFTATHCFLQNRQWTLKSFFSTPCCHVLVYDSEVVTLQWRLQLSERSKCFLAALDKLFLTAPALGLCWWHWEPKNCSEKVQLVIHHNANCLAKLAAHSGFRF